MSILYYETELSVASTEKLVLSRKPALVTPWQAQAAPVPTLRDEC